jgi:signal transduction histidine kinase
LFNAYALYVILSSGAVFIFIWQMYIKSRGMERTRALLVLSGLFLSFMIVIGTNVLYPQFYPPSLPVSRIGLASLFFMTALPAYAIIRYRFLDVTVVLRRTASYLAILIMMLSTYALSIFLLGNALKGYLDLSERNTQILALLVLAISVFPLKALADRYLNRYLFRGIYNQRDFLKEAEGLLSLKQELQPSLAGLSRRLCEAMGVKCTTFLILSEGNGEQVMFNTGWKLGAIPGEYESTVIDTSHVEEILLNRNRIVVRDELSYRLRDRQPGPFQMPNELLRQMDKLGIAVSMPILFKGRSTGLLLMGEKVNKRDFSTQDIDFLRSLVQRVAYVVDHHRLYAELKQKYEELDTAYGQLKDIDRFKTDIIAITNHELRKPLTLIKGYIDLLHARLEMFDEDKRRELLSMAKKGTDQLAGLLDDIRVVTDIETGKLSISSMALDLHDMAREVEGFLSPEYPATFVYGFPDRLPGVYGDRDKVMVVLANLMENASKFAGEHGEIEVGAYTEEDGVVLFVKDQGPGLSQEHLDSIFGLFSLIEDADHHSKDGLGLGLYIARKLVEMHDGRIWGESEPGSGAAFFFYLPAREEDSGPRNPERSVSGIAAPESGGPLSNATSQPGMTQKLGFSG